MDFKDIRGNAWSIENMEAHDAAGRSVTEIGSETINGRTYTYYRDNAGAYWYHSTSKEMEELDAANKRKEAIRKAQYNRQRYRSGK